MNLIEQLGGYEESKKYLELSKYSWYDDLVKELLDYRREHKIYEVGDIIVHPNMTYGYLYEIYEIKGSLIKVRCLSIGGRKSISFKSDIRHATNEEIKAGKRL